MYVVGLTGGIGSGKSTVSAMLAARGAQIIDADVLAREVVEPGTAGFGEVVDAFGQDVVGPDGALDRSKLGSIVFADADKRKKLESIIWPRVGAAVADRLRALSDTDCIVILDVPLMAEATDGSRRFAQRIIVVDASPESQIRHLEAKGVSREDAQARMAAQAARDERLKIADFVLRNDGTIEELEKQVDAVWTELLEASRA
ncbi:MAG: dephospho-CoA kinase [Actinomycetota bacterium]|nr:dephospho-CoA kinase [Actinomycetota bacterium]